MNLFQELKFLFQSLASILGVNMEQRLVVQILPQTTHLYSYIKHAVIAFILQARWTKRTVLLRATWTHRVVLISVSLA